MDYFLGWLPVPPQKKMLVATQIDALIKKDPLAKGWVSRVSRFNMAG